MISIDNRDSNINYLDEDNWSILPDGSDLWCGFPFKSGDMFPTEQIKYRAQISKTNQALYNGEIERVFSDLINSIRDIDPYQGQQVREIVTSLPYPKNITNAWESLIVGVPPIIDTSGEHDREIQTIVEQSNINQILKQEIKSRFIDTIGAYLVDIDLNNNPTIIPIQNKNLIVYVNRDNPTCVEVCVVFSTYVNTDDIQLIDFLEYHYNGKIVKRTYHYNNGRLGPEYCEALETWAFGGKFKQQPIVLFRHNAEAGKVYGVDGYRYVIPQMLLAMRALKNLAKLGERQLEIIRKIPEGALQKQPNTGETLYLNKGTITYNSNSDTSSPDIEFITPSLPIDNMCKVLEKAVEQVAIDSQLGIAFFNLSKLQSSLQADSIRAQMFPARLEADRIKSEMLPSIKELIIKLCLLGGIEIKPSDVQVNFIDNFPTNKDIETKIIQSRLESSAPSIQLVDAIVRLDRVPLRVAKDKADEILGKTIDIRDDKKIDIQSSQGGLTVSTSDINNNKVGSVYQGNKENNVVIDYQNPFYGIEYDHMHNKSKGVSKWLHFHKRTNKF